MGVIEVLSRGNTTEKILLKSNIEEGVEGVGASVTNLSQANSGQ